MEPLDASKRRALRAQAHHLHPVVFIGQHGLTPAVLHEIDVNLLAHELIKLRIFSDDRAQREALLAEICAALDAAPVQHLGKTLVLYRPKPAEEKAAATEARPAKPRAKGKLRVARTDSQARERQPSGRGRRKATPAGPPPKPLSRAGARKQTHGAVGAVAAPAQGGQATARRSPATPRSTAAAAPPRARRRA